ncbi:MAG: hypothetical protein IJ298_00445 [Ruminococcus sp.]|nr:hypothetical protein [Ruminococcus sp.]
MKKRIVLIVSVILVFAVALGVGAFMLFDTSRESMARILISNYDRHNAVTTDGGSLVQVGARLYYSVDTRNNPVNYGIYEITNRGIDRIWWDGIKSPATNVNYHNTLAVYDEHLAMVDSETGQISLFDFDEGEFVPEEGLMSEYVLERNQYQKYQTENDSAVLFISLFGKTYYVVDRNATPVLYRDIPDTEEDLMLYDFSSLEGDVVCRDIYTRNATVYVEYVDDTGLCCLEYYPETEEVIIVGTEDYIGRPVSLNKAARVNNLPVYDEATTGIFVTDINTKESIKVYDGDVEEYHVLDDQWIYFVLEDHSLWRVSLDGETLEQVF